MPARVFATPPSASGRRFCLKAAAFSDTASFVMNKPHPESRMATLLVCLILFDLLTKLLAYNCLPHGQKSFFIQDVGAIKPIYNPIAVDAQHPPLIRTRKPSTPMDQGIAISVVALIVMVLKHAKARLGYKWIIGVVIFCAASRVMKQAGAFNLPQFRHGAVILIVKFLVIALFLLCYQYSQSAWFKTAYILAVAGALGNILSYAYPPWHVIDFILSSRFGYIFNCADIFVVCGVAMLVISPVYLIIRFLVRTVRATNAQLSKPAPVLPYEL
jgi:lipoprotein signal peptidase